MLQYAITTGEASFQAGQDKAESPPYTRQQTIDRSVQLARQGVSFLLIREKRLCSTALLDFTRQIVKAIGSDAPGTCTRILLSSRPDLAIAGGAQGVHLSSSPGELTPEQVRSVMPGAIVSVSCHTVDEIRLAHERQASLALFAPVFGKWTDGVQVVPGTGLKILNDACSIAPGLPVFALGGVTPANAPQCLDAGAAGVAGVRLFFTKGTRP